MQSKSKTRQSDSIVTNDDGKNVINESFKRVALSVCDCSDNRQHLSPSYHSRTCSYYLQAEARTRGMSGS